MRGGEGGKEEEEDTKEGGVFCGKQLTTSQLCQTVVDSQPPLFLISFPFFFVLFATEFHPIMSISKRNKPGRVFASSFGFFFFLFGVVFASCQDRENVGERMASQGRSHNKSRARRRRV